MLTMFLARRAKASVWAVWPACSSAALTLAMITALQLPPMESCGVMGGQSHTAARMHTCRDGAHGWSPLDRTACADAV